MCVTIQPNIYKMLSIIYKWIHPWMDGMLDQEAKQRRNITDTMKLIKTIKKT